MAFRRETEPDGRGGDNVTVLDALTRAPLSSHGRPFGQLQCRNRLNFHGHDTRRKASPRYSTFAPPSGHLTPGNHLRGHLSAVLVKVMVLRFRLIGLLFKVLGLLGPELASLVLGCG